MSKTKFLRCMLTLCLGLACSVGWAQLTEGMVSTSMSDLKPYTLKNLNNLYMGSYTSPTNTLPAGFAFFDDGVDGTENAYKIYCAAAGESGQWVSYDQADSYSNGTNKVKFVDSQDDAKAWVITPATNSSTACWQIAPLKSDGNVASIYMNWFNGVSGNPVDNTTTTIGYWQNGASSDAGSAWLFAETTLATAEAVAEAKALLKTGIGYPKTTNTAYITLNNLKAGLAADIVEPAKTAYTSCTDIQMPEAGKCYRFGYAFNDGMRYIQSETSPANSLSLAMTSAEDRKSVFLVEEIDGNLRLKSISTGKYLDESGNNRGLYDTGANVTFSAGAEWGKIKIQATKYCHANSKDSNYFVDHCGSDGCTAHNFVAVEVDFLPKAGATYYIYSDTYYDGSYVNRFLYADGSELKMNTSLQEDASYQWTCTVNEDGTMYFQNGDGKYLGYKTMSDAGYAYTVASTKAHNFDAVTLYANANSRYIVVLNDGTKFDQSTKTYNQETENYCTDFVFIPVDEVKLLSVNAPSKVSGTVTWNDETKDLPATWTYLPGTIIANPNLSVNLHSAYELVSLKENETDLGTTVSISELTTDRTIVVEATPAFFSSTYGEKWVRLQNCGNLSYWATLNNAEDGGTGTTSTLNIADEKQLWCLVGTAEEFVLYNKAAGNTLALNVPYVGDATEAAIGNPALLSSTQGKWKLIEQEFGYAFVPTNGNSSNYGINMYGGPGGDLKLYTAGIDNKGSYWMPQMVDANSPLTISAAVDKVWESSPRVAELTVTLAGQTSTTRILGNVSAQTYYLPTNATFSLGSMTYRGYTFNGFLNANGNADSYEDATIPEGGLTVTASYTANDERTLYYTPSATGHPYRIPAIATAPNGDIFAICDHRPCGNDIGYGEVDLVCRVSSDNGVTWTDERTIADGLGHINDGIWKMGFGDPAIVADRERNEVLVMSVCGNRTCWDGNYGAGTDDNPENPNRVARIRIKYDENTNQWVFGEPEEVTNSIYPKFVDEDGNVHAASLFIGAGKICQSRVVKKKDYYRLYCAVWNVTTTQRQHHNYVIYSDDFGETWEVLGELGYDNSPAKYGNEPKCEELPDGTVVLSSRKSYGRYFNLFKFSDETFTTGSWQGEVSSNDVENGLSFGANSTNGEIYKVKAVRNSDGATCDVMLQSVPTGSSRSDVAIFYKEMDYTTPYTSTAFAQNWTLGKQVSDRGSAYSTMIKQADGKIAFFFEEEPGGYCMVYVPLTLSEITGGNYSLYYEGEEAATLKEEAEAALDKTGVGYPVATAAARTTLSAAIEAVNAEATSYEAIVALRSALTAYTKSTDDIQMPESGKTYVIYNVLQGASSNTASTNNVLRYDEASGVLTVAQKSATDDDAEKFVCRVIDAEQNLYAFVNAKNGKYVLYYSPKAGDAAKPYAADEDDNATGFAASYNNVTDYYQEDAKVNDLFIYPAAEKCFGTMAISCKADAIAYEGWVTMVVTQDGLYMNNGIAGGAAQITYGFGESSCFAFEEVSYPNNVKLNTIGLDDVCVHGLGEGNGIGTFSAPFATVLPEGVTAYYADSKNADGVSLEELGTRAVPANQGVILVGESGIASSLMIPARTNGTDIAAGATIEGNQFSHTAGTTRVLQTGDFILAMRVKQATGDYIEDNGIAFYQGTVGTTLGKNKAYVVLGENTSASKACHLNFGEEATGIEGVNMDGESTGAVYDLSGRRVTQLLKGGVYIRDGKKFIVK